MPIENERKFCLALAAETQFSDFYTIRQGYLPQKDYTVRIRRTEKDHEIRHWFTFKKKIDKKILEIEQLISERDFNSLAREAKFWVHKVRVKFQDWDIDFFKNNNATYFALAEVELPEDQLFPNEIPNFIGEFLLYTVPVNDRRFSSKKLSNVQYARKLYSIVTSQSVLKLYK